MVNDTTYSLNILVRVRWYDASTKGGWGALHAYKKHAPAECVSVGYLVRHDKHAIVLAQTLAHDGDVNSAIAIPFVWVTHIDALKVQALPKAKRAQHARKTKKR